MGIYTVFKEELYYNKIAYYHNGIVKTKSWFEDFGISSKEISIGIDQSSTCTGLYLEGDNDKLMIEYPRDFIDLEVYKKAVTNEIDNLIFNSSVKHFIYEIHNHISTRESPLYEMTQELKKYAKQETFYNTIIKGVLPSVWRKGFLNKSEYSGEYTRDKVKDASFRQTIKEEPMLMKFFGFSHKDLDGYEAYGILKGYLNLNYTKEGLRRVNTTMNTLKSRNFSYEIFVGDEFNISKKIKEFNIPLLIGNNEINLKESCNRALDEYEDCLILINGDHPEVPRYILETGVPYEDGLIYLIHTKKRGI